ncbi:MAG: hypothetical protein CMP28_02610, partial [Roseibacillus sp.]|nr:hypothetical protein [Roseibacillus sp.]
MNTNTIRRGARQAFLRLNIQYSKVNWPLRIVQPVRLSILMCMKIRALSACLLLPGAIFSCSPPAAKPIGNQRPAPSPPPSLVSPQGAPPVVAAERMIVVDAASGQVLTAKNADERCAVASTQKLLTALLVSEAGPLHDPVVIQSSDLAVEPTKLYLTPGHTYTRAQLLKAILVRS